MSGELLRYLPEQLCFGIPDGDNSETKGKFGACLPLGRLRDLYSFFVCVPVGKVLVCAQKEGQSVDRVNRKGSDFGG